MKKLLSLLIAVVFTIGNTAFAADLNYSEATSSSTLTYHVDSSFCVVIPETLDAFNGFQLTSSYMNITDSEQVNVYINGENSIAMSNEHGDTFNMQLTLNDNDRIAEFLKNQETSDNIVYGNWGNSDAPSAGDYSGTVEFLVRLEMIN